MKMYWYPRCGTCVKALKHYRANGIEPQLIDLSTAPPDKAALRAMWRASGLDLRKFFNTSGQSYRNGDFGKRLAGMSDDEQLEALAADGMLIKRPIVLDDGVVRVGFREDDN